MENDVKTILKITKERNQFYLLWLSSEEKIRVSEDCLIEKRLLKGQEISDEIIQEIQTSNNVEAGFQLALNYLSYQTRTEREMRNYLVKKEIESIDREKIIQRLINMQLINDQQFSESYVRTQMKISDKGPKVIEQQLKQKGLSPENIQHGLIEYSVENQLEVAQRVASKAMKRYQTKSFQEAKQKVRYYLLQKGFTSDITERVMEELAFEKDEEKEWESLQKEGDKLWQKHHLLPMNQRAFKVKQSLFQKRFDTGLIQQYISEKEMNDV